MKIKTYCYEEWNRFNYKVFENRGLVISKRISMAKRFYDRALVDFYLESYEFCADRLYFSVLTACRALLLSVDKESGDFHSLALRVYLNFVLKGLLQRKDYDLLIELYNLWQKLMFAPLVYPKKEDVEPYIKPVKDLLRRIGKILNTDQLAFKFEKK